jgi:tetratricopeptide (TPR) repeat protein
MDNKGPTTLREEVIEAIRLSRIRQYDAALDLLKTVLDKNEVGEEEKAVLHSTSALILRQKGEKEEALNAYSKAESCLPDDPILKIILSRFLIEETEQYDLAIKKAKQILKSSKDIPSLRHQAYCLIGHAYLKQGIKKRAVEMLEKAMSNSFAGISSVENIDFSLVEALLRRNLEVEKCQHYVDLACDLARQNREFKAMAKFRKILDSFSASKTTS